jgi:hypothetical protein
MKGRLAGFPVAGCVLAFGLMVAAGRLARAEDTSLVAGAWKVTFAHGTVQKYEITRHGDLTRTRGNVKTAGKALRQYAGYTDVTLLTAAQRRSSICTASISSESIEKQADIGCLWS